MTRGLIRQKQKNKNSSTDTGTLSLLKSKQTVTMKEKNGISLNNIFLIAMEIKG